MKKTIILYHAKCLDGFTAAWAAWKKLKDKATYIPVKHGAPPSKELTNKTIYMVDFAFKKKIMQSLIANNTSVTVLDHHITAEENLKSLRNPTSERFQLTFDNDHSGAHLSWKHFHPKKKVPQLVQYVEDGDLWRFKNANSKELVSFLTVHDFSFATWNKLEKLFENIKTKKESIEKGALIRQYEKKVIKDVTSSAVIVKFAGHKVLAANCPVLRSEIGHELVETRGPFSIIWREKGGQIVVSLRANGKVDVAKIAEKYGGGGHKNAAGFTIKKGHKVPWKAK